MIGINKNTRFELSEITLGNAYTILGRSKYQNSMVIIKNDNNKINSYPEEWFDIIDDSSFIAHSDVGYITGNNDDVLVKDNQDIFVGTYEFKLCPFGKDHFTVGKEYQLISDKNYLSMFVVLSDKGEAFSVPKLWFGKIREFNTGLGIYKIIPREKLRPIILDGMYGYVHH